MMPNQAPTTSAACPQGADGRADPITLEVVRYKLEGIANEMESTLLRSSFSTIVKEGMDASASLFTVGGETIAQALAIPGHMTMLIPMVATLLREFPPNTMKPGDLFVMNDPYLGGTHLPDIALVNPVFMDGEVVALSAALTHHQDVGGMTPGSIPTNATEIFQEGFRIPPLRFHDAGVPNETLLKLLRLNTRTPDALMGDLNAQIAACKIGARRLLELGATYGRKALLALFAEMLDHSERVTRARLREIPEGTFRYVDHLDYDGIDLDTPVRIEVAVTVKDGSFHVDFTGSNAQLRGPFNVVESGSLAAACFVVRAITGSDIPTNAGCFRPVSLHRPVGTLVSPVEPAPVGSRTATTKRITSCILGALRGVLPARVPADGAGVLLGLAFGGMRAETSKPFVSTEILVGGTGASATGDGADVIETDVTNCMNTPVEALEMDAPLRVHRLELRPDSGGRGQFRGGLGLVKEFEFLGTEVVCTHRGERHVNPARGAFGGGEGARETSRIVRASGEVEEVPSKLVTRLRNGDRIIIETPGGGGYGDARMRSPERVRDDVADGKVSIEKARELYGWSA